MKENKIAKSSIWYILGNFFNRGIAFLTIPIYTRILTTNEYGLVSTYIATVAMLSIVIGIALHMSVRSSFVDYKNNEYDFLSSMIYLNNLSTVLFSILIFIFYIILMPQIHFIIILAVIIQSHSSSILQYFSIFLMMKIRYKLRTLMIFLPNLLTNIISIFVIIFVLNNDKYLGRIFVGSLIYFVFSIFVQFYVNNKSKISYNKEYIRYALKISVPIVFHGLSLSILNQSDRIMLTTIVGPTQTGIYSLIYNFSMIAMILISSVEGVWVPWFTRKMNEKKYDQINKSSKIYINFISISILMILMVSPEVLRLLAPKEYWEGFIIIPPIIVSSFIVFCYTLYVNVEHFYKKTISIAKNTIIAAALNIILNFIFIKNLGYFGAALTTLLSFLISFVLHSRNSKKIQKSLLPLKLFILPTSVIFIISILFYLIIDLFILRYLFVFVLIIFSIKYVKKIMNFYSKKIVKE